MPPSRGGKLRDLPQGGFDINAEHEGLWLSACLSTTIASDGTLRGASGRKVFDRGQISLLPQGWDQFRIDFPRVRICVLRSNGPLLRLRPRCAGGCHQGPPNSRPATSVGQLAQ